MAAWPVGMRSHFGARTADTLLRRPPEDCQSPPSVIPPPDGVSTADRVVFSSMAEHSLLSDELRAHIGRSNEPRTAVVTIEAVHRAMGVYGGDVTRPFNQGDVVPGYVVVGLVSDGEGFRIPVPLPKSLLVSNEFAIERPIRLGETIVAQSRVADISERLGGQFGHGIYVRTDMEFRDPQGTLIGRTSNTLMHYDPAGARREEASR